MTITETPTEKCRGEESINFSGDSVVDMADDKAKSHLCVWVFIVQYKFMFYFMFTQFPGYKHQLPHTINKQPKPPIYYH